MAEVKWRQDLKVSREEASRQGKLVLIDLFNPH